MIKRTLLAAAILMMVFSRFAVAQSEAEIRESGRYIWGVGAGATYPEAMRTAQEMLVNSISVIVVSEFSEIVTETNNELNSYVEAVVQTYSTGVITDTRHRLLKEEPGNVEVLVFITRDDMQKKFDERREMAVDFTRLAEKAERENRIGDALRRYYWASVLMRTYPFYRDVRYTFADGGEVSLLSGLNDKIAQIFTFLKPEIRSVTSSPDGSRNTIGLVFNHRGQPVQNLDFIYHTGDYYSTVQTIRDGRGLAMLPADLTQLHIVVEYQYLIQAHREPEVKAMLDNTSLPTFPEATYRLPVNAKPEVVLVDHTPPIEPDNLHSTKKVTGFSGASNQGHYRTVIGSIADGIRQNNHQSVQGYFTHEAFENYLKLIKSGNVTLLQLTDTLRIISVNDEVMVRSLPMLFAYENNRRQFVEDVVFIFNNDGLVSNISFALGHKAISDIVNRNEEWGATQEKYYLIRFMEDYKTAYALKRLNFIESIFAEEALIIVGHVLNVVKDVENPFSSHEIVKYNTYTKQQYIRNLESNFRRNEFINIQFEDNLVKRTQQPDQKVYGIQISQQYYSSTYADKGYLFLMIDLNDTLNPKIYVRTWQPEKNPDGSIYGLEDFYF
jgi:hypothetical protein